MDTSPINHLLNESGPILRWLTASQLKVEDHSQNRQALLADLLVCEEVHHWLGLLGSGPVHHSMDASLENVLAKLAEYGFRAGMADLDEHVSPYFAIADGEAYHAEALILVPFLVRLGYFAEPRVAYWIAQRIDLLYELARRQDYDFFMSATERQRLPPSQHSMHSDTKLFYRPHFNSHWGYLGLPTCYDLYLMAYLPKDDPLTQQKVEQIVLYLLDPRFQEISDGYIWNAHLHRPYAAGRVFLACLPGDNLPEKLVLFLELMAHFASGRKSAWFSQGLAHLETFRTERGTYCFPPRYLSEKQGYYLYGGMHMGLGEMPRNRHALELESTFRMLRLKASP
ncbi:MAG: hypothetical protein C3F13_13610 [Anaerolineales bacterium]|nr:MAG: hypothetical protein C3F13_13610 [Anaerolineales bacterium]